MRSQCVPVKSTSVSVVALLANASRKASPVSGCRLHHLNFTLSRCMEPRACAMSWIQSLKSTSVHHHMDNSTNPGSNTPVRPWHALHAKINHYVHDRSTVRRECAPRAASLVTMATKAPARSCRLSASNKLDTLVLASASANSPRPWIELPASTITGKVSEQPPLHVPGPCSKRTA